MGAHIHHLDGNTGFGKGADPAVDTLGAGCAQQHILTIFAIVGAQHLKIETHFIKGEGNDLLGLQLHLTLQLLVAEAGINLDHLGYHVGAGHRSGGIVAVSRDQALEALERLADTLDILQLIVNQRPFRGGNIGDRLEMKLARSATEGNGLDGLAAKINAHQREEGSLVKKPKHIHIHALFGFIPEQSVGHPIRGVLHSS